MTRRPGPACGLLPLILACTPTAPDPAPAAIGADDPAPGQTGVTITDATKPQGSGVCDGTDCCPAGSTPITYTENPDNIANAASDVCLVALGGADEVVSTQTGSLVVLAGPGDDTVRGGAGSNILFGGDGDDSLSGRNNADELHGGFGQDSLHGGGGVDILDGGPGDDMLYGNGGADILRGGPGMDTVSASSGDDVIILGAACEVVSGETIDGGTGTDRVESPLSQTELLTRGVSLSSIEQFVQIAPLFDQCLTVTTPWGATPLDPGPAGAAVLDAVPLDSGGALVATWSEVFVVSAAGAVTSSVSGLRAFLNPTGDAFGVLTATGFKVYSPTGGLLYTIPPPVEQSAFRLVPRRTYTHESVFEVIDADTLRSHETRLYDGTGTLLASLSTPAGLGRSRLSSNHLYLTTDDALRRFEVDGTPAGQIALAPMFFEVASDAANGRVVAVRVTSAVEVIHLDGVTQLASTTITGAPWNAAISPNGTYSAVNSRDTLWVFEDGQPIASRSLPFSYGKSLAVNDRGEVFVAGSDSSGASRLVVYHHLGDALFTVELAADVTAYRPAVKIAPGGDRFFALESGGVTMYEIERDL